MNKITFNAEDHSYHNEHGVRIPCVSDILEHFGITDFSRVRTDVLEQSQEFGHHVHEACALYDRGDLLSCDDEIMPYLEGWKSYRKNNCISNFELIETPLYSKVWGFAGTPDRYSNNTIWDIKSGCEYPSHRIQLSLYQILAEENLDVRIKKRICVYLNSKGGYKLVEYKSKTDASIAKSLLQLYSWKRKNKLC